MLRLPDRTDRMALLADVLTIEGLIDVGIKARKGSDRVLLLVVAVRQEAAAASTVQGTAARCKAVAVHCAPLFWAAIMWRDE